MEDKNEKGAKIIGIVVLVMTIVGAVAAGSIIIAFFLMMRSCSADNKPDNTGKKPYTQDYVEGYLERRYDRYFTFVSEHEEEPSEYEKWYVYTYSDADGVEFDVVQSFRSGYMFNGHYEVTDYYMSKLLLENKEFMGEIEASGFSYVLNSSESQRSPMCCFYVKSEAEAGEAAGFVYDLSKKYVMSPASLCKSYNEEWGNFSSGGFSLVVEYDPKNGTPPSILANESPVQVYKQEPYDEGERRILVNDARDLYKRAAERAAAARAAAQTTSTEG